MNVFFAWVFEPGAPGHGERILAVQAPPREYARPTALFGAVSRILEPADSVPLQALICGQCGVALHDWRRLEFTWNAAPLSPCEGEYPNDPRGVTDSSLGLKRAQRAIPQDRKPSSTTPVGVAELLCMQLLRPLKGSMGGVLFPGVSPARYRTRPQPPATSCHPYGMDLICDSMAG